jgi:predicted TPR repeat methyltransferase
MNEPIGPDPFEQARAGFVAGLAHLEAGRLADAEAAFERSLELLPGRPSTLTNLGVVRLRLGRPAQAVPLLQQAAQAEPGNFEAWAHLGLALAGLGRDAQALPALERAVQLQPAHARVRFELAGVLGRLQRAADALPQAQALLAGHPAHAPGWTLLGNLLRELGRAGEAADAFERALACGGDAELNRFLLAGVRGTAGAAAPPRPPDVYVRSLFDDYAPDFDRHLVEVLHYRAHTQVAALLRRDGRRLGAVLDLGCGTGLLAPLLAPVAERIDGVDLSPPMLEQARARGLYAALDAADLGEHLRRTPRRYAAVAAADVFIYVGALEPVFAGVSRVLQPQGLFAFSVERADEADDFVLRPSLRYAHGERGLRALAARHGFTVEAVETGPIREDRRQPIEGLYLLLRKR